MVMTGRVERLRDLIAQLELLPASPDRDRLLSEFRSRAVDVDTGVTPRAILPLREPESAPAADKRAPAPEGARSAPPAASHAVEPAQPAPAAARPTLEPVDESSWGDERLSLEDSTPAQALGAGGRAVPPWTLGLRG